MDYLSLLGLELKTTVAAGIGAFFAALMAKGKSIKDRIISFLAGFAFATFLTKPVIAFFNLSDASYAGGIGFVLGFLGMSVAEAALKLIQETAWSEIIKLRFGK